MIYEDMEYINKCLFEELPKRKWQKRKNRTAFFITKEQSRQARINREQNGNYRKYSSLLGIV